MSSGAVVSNEEPWGIKVTWVDERLYPHWRQSFDASAELLREQTPYQEIVVVETISHGRVMLLDGVVQITEADEFVYQEMISHVPLLQHGNVGDVLIIGAGDGGVLRRVLQHSMVRRVVLAEIDEAVVRISRQYFPNVGGNAWVDARAQVTIQDGIAHVHETPSASYDVIIVDSTDPAGPGESLFTASFYKACAKALRPNGILVNQCGVPFMQPSELSDSSKKRRTAFVHVSAYVVAVPTYVGGFMTLGIASNSPVAELSVDELTARGTQAGILGRTQYWSPAIHCASFALPPYISKQLAQC